MGRGKRQHVFRDAPQGHIIPLSDERLHELPQGLRDSLAAAATELAAAPLASGLGCRVHRLKGPNVGRALTMDDDEVWVNDKLKFVVGKAVMAADGRLVVTGRRGVAEVALEQDSSWAQVTDRSLRLGRLSLQRGSTSAYVFDRDGSWVGRVYAKRGQQLDLRLAGVAAYCLLALDLPTEASP